MWKSVFLCLSSHILTSDKCRQIACAEGKSNSITGFIKRNSGSDAPVRARSAVHCIIQFFSAISSAISFAPKRKPCRNPSRSVSVISLLYLSESSDIFSFCPLSVKISPNASSVFTTSDNALLASSLCGYTGTPTRPRGGERRSRAAYKPCHT